MGGKNSTLSTTTVQPPVTAAVSELQHEPWFAEMKYEDSATVSEGLSSCYGAMEAAWSSRSGSYKMINDIKLKHSYSSCKSYLELALHRELSQCQDEGSYWYTINVASSATSTILFILLTVLLARLRRSNRIKSKLKRHLPEKLWNKTKKTKSWFRKKHGDDSDPDQTAHSRSPSGPAFSIPTAHTDDYHYMGENQYKPPVHLDNNIGYPRREPRPLQQPTSCRDSSSYSTRTPRSYRPLPGTPNSPYPNILPRGTILRSTTNLPVPAARQTGDAVHPGVLQASHHGEGQEQADVMDGGMVMQGGEQMDRNLHIAEQNTNNKDY